MINFKEYFTYENGKLYNKVTRDYDAVQGAKAGKLSPETGYVKVKIKGKKYFEHRIVWEVMKGSLKKDMDVTHINGVKHDNRIENLEVK